MKTSYKIITVVLLVLFISMGIYIGYLSLDNKDLKLEIAKKEQVISEQDSKIKELLSTNNLLLEDSTNKEIVIKALENQNKSSDENCKKTLSNLEQLYLVEEKIKNEDKSAVTIGTKEENKQIKEYIKLRNKIYKTLK